MSSSISGHSLYVLMQGGGVLCYGESVRAQMLMTFSAHNILFSFGFWYFSQEM